MSRPPPRPLRLAVVVSHPIQHFAPFYRAIAAEPDIDLKVFFASRIGLDRYFDAEMNTEIAWAMDLVGGYAHQFLEGAERIKRTGFREVDNPDVGAALGAFAPHALVIHGYTQLTALKALAWARRTSAPALLFSESHHGGPRSLLRRAGKAALLPAVARQFKAFLTISDASAAYWPSYGAKPESVFRAPSTIDEAAYRRARRERAAIRAAFRAEHGVAGDAIVALAVGKLSPRKRPLDLVDAARLLADQGLGLHCMFAGDGALLDELRARIAATGVAASALGFVNVDRLPEVYAAADVFAHMASFEAFGYVANEAACVGLPLVLSERMGAIGPTSIARPGENAEVFACGDIEALAAVLRRVAFDPARRAAMGAASERIFDELDIRRSLAGLKAALAYSVPGYIPA